MSPPFSCPLRFLFGKGIALTFYHVYADESRQDAHCCMLYGLLFIPRGKPERSLREDYTRLRQQHHWGTGEFNWEKVSHGKMNVYKKFVELFFNHVDTECRCLVVDTQKINYKASHNGDRETAFYEFYFQAISHNLHLEDEYLVFTDDQQNRQPNRLTDLKSKTNYHWLLKGAEDGPVRNVEPRASKMEDLLQITNVLLGAMGYDIEERAESLAKVERVAVESPGQEPSFGRGASGRGASGRGARGRGEGCRPVAAGLLSCRGSSPDA